MDKITLNVVVSLFSKIHKRLVVSFNKRFVLKPVGSSVYESIAVDLLSKYS
jgi:hypothetical protein